MTDAVRIQKIKERLELSDKVALTMPERNLATMLRWLLQEYEQAEQTRVVLENMADDLTERLRQEGVELEALRAVVKQAVIACQESIATFETIQSTARANKGWEWLHGLAEWDAPTLCHRTMDMAAALAPDRGER